MALTEVAIDSLAAGGRGVGRVEGLVWLVEGGIPGDLVEALPTKEHRRLVEARVVRLIQPSFLRREPPCPIQQRCGGCPWMVLGEESQRSFKRKIVEDSLRRLGRMGDVPVEEVIPSPMALAYRNKVELTFARDETGRTVLGFHGADPQRGVVDVEGCLLQGESANRVLGFARSFFLHGPGKDSRALGDPREPLRLVIRRSGSTGRILVALRGAAGPFAEAMQFARSLREAVPEVVSVVRLIARPGQRGGARAVSLVGPSWIEEKLCGITFHLPAASFLQVNPGAAELLVNLVLELSGPVSSRTVLELYGGVGVLALALARRGALATTCEADPDAVACGRSAARENGGLPVRFVRSDVRAFLARAELRTSVRPGVVIADPPRSGLGRGVAEGIAGLAPDRVVLVSCDPTTLARDASVLVSQGYRVQRVVPIDLFPQTPHVEALMLLQRGSGGASQAVGPE